jgi:hypothetical protein
MKMESEQNIVVISLREMFPHAEREAYGRARLVLSGPA